VTLKGEEPPYVVGVDNVTEGNKAKAFAAALGQSIADDAAEVENAAQQIVQQAPARQYTVTPNNKLTTTWGQVKKYK